MRKYLELAFISVISIAATIIVLDNKPSVIDGGNAEYGCSTEEITNMYENYIEKWKADVKIAFDKAGLEVLKEDIQLQILLDLIQIPRNALAVDLAGLNKEMVIKQNVHIMEKVWLK